MVPPSSVCVSLPVSATMEGQDGSLVPLLTTDSQGFWNLPCEPLRLPGAAAQPWAHSLPLPDILPSAPSTGCSLCPGGVGVPKPRSLHPGQLPAACQGLTAPTGHSQCPPPATENTSPWGGNPCAKAPRPRAQDSDGSSKAETASVGSVVPLQPRQVGGAWGWSWTPSAAVHATHTCGACHSWRPQHFRRGEAPAASGAPSAPQGCFHRPAGVGLTSAGRTCSAGGLGTREDHHTPAAERPEPRTVPGTSILTLRIAARPKILLLSFRINDSLAQPASGISRKTIT